MKRNNTFGLAFLDIMFCGFGAVVLLVMLLNGQTLQKRDEAQKDLREELERATQLEKFSRNYLIELQQELELTVLQEGKIRVDAENTKKSILEFDSEQKKLELRTASNSEEIRALIQRKNELDADAKSIKKTLPQNTDNSLKGFDGDGKRQYLTGLKLRGDRTLILVDASASMLDETIVNIVRRKLMSPEIRNQSPKWQRAIRTVDWLLSNLKESSQFQLYYFNTEVKPAIANTQGQWLTTGNKDQLLQSLETIKRLAPEKGTDLRSALNSVKALKPLPDSVVLITDGLPTQLKGEKVAASVTGGQRLDFFRRSIAVLPNNVPVNTLLFPIEGDPAAAASFWELAYETKGSFITPSRDWP